MRFLRFKGAGADLISVGGINQSRDCMSYFKYRLTRSVVVRKSLYHIIAMFHEKIRISLFHLIYRLFGIADHTDCGIKQSLQFANELILCVVYILRLIYKEKL
jgi:hypothetical protein